MKPCLYAAALPLLLSAPRVAPAAPAPDDEGAARKVAETCLGAIHRRDWKALAAHLDPESLRELKATVAPALKRAAKGGAEDFQAGVVLGMLGGADPEKLLALPPREFFVAFTAATFPEGQRWPFAGMEARVVGTAREGRDLLHVLYRARGQAGFAEGVDDRGKGGVKRLKLEGEVTRLGVLTLRRAGGGWKALVPDEVRLVAAYLGAEWREK
jgi:hypothetical protein